MKKMSVVAVMVGVFLLAAMGQAQAQLKIRYIDSQKVLENYPQFQEAQKKLEELRQKYETEFSQMQQEAQNLYEELQNQSLLLSPEKKAEKEAELQNLATQLERYQYEKLGPQGELYRKNKELTDPIIDKITQVIRRIGEEDDYDFILDAVGGTVLHAKPEYDITERVIEELNKMQ
jgi:Skp family chaperone for outer membrane proteins